MSNNILTIFQVSMLVALISHLEADNEDSDCESAIKVRRNTVYEVFTGQELKVACPVHVCNDYAPTVTWFKLDKEEFTRITIQTSERVKTEWTKLNNAEGISFLILQNVSSSDSGQYRCQSRSFVSHSIRVSVVCPVEVKVSRNTVFATAGEQLKIACPVHFCNSRVPTVNWFKQGPEEDINVNISDRVLTEWTELNSNEGISFLIFQNVSSSDSGQYFCLSGNSVSHTISVFVNVTEAEPESLTQWSFVFRLVGLLTFFIIVTTVYIIIKKRKCKRVQRPQSSPATKGDRQTLHIYDNDL